MARLKTVLPLWLVRLVTLTPVLLRAFSATVLPTTSPTPDAFEVLPLVAETRLETLVVGQTSRVPSMWKPGTK